MIRDEAAACAFADTYGQSDAAYVLGALDDAERRAYEQHLATCPACRAGVDEIAGVPAMLAGVRLEEVLDPAPAGPPPDTLLPRLLREAAAVRRRRRLLAGAGALAAACVAALVAVLVTSSASSPSAPTARALTQVIRTPVHARVTLAAHRGGTRLELTCHDGARSGTRLEYAMTVVDDRGHRHDLSSWYIKPRQTLTFTADTLLPRPRIDAVEVTLPDGRPILRLRT